MHDDAVLRDIHDIIAAAPPREQEFIRQYAQQLRGMVECNVNAGLAIALVGAEMSAEAPWFTAIANRR